MDLVTLTDHDSIEGCEELRGHPDFFVSEEVTCRMPSGTEAHVAVYDINERQHVEIGRRRDDLPRLISYLERERLFFSAQHVFSSLTGRREASDFECFASHFPAIETLNSHLLSRSNTQATQFARLAGKSPTAGSDGHTLRSIGSAFVRVRGARNKAEFFEGLRNGRGEPCGESGGYWKLTRDVLQIVHSMLAEDPKKMAWAWLAPWIPAFTLLHFCQERLFTRRWEHILAGKGDTARGQQTVNGPRAGSAEAVA